VKVANSILELIGETPILKLNHMTKDEGAAVYVKLESFNPGGSIKDRPGLHMIERADQNGEIRPGSIILEATSGNTGIGLAMAAVVKGYPITIVMPENMSDERKKLLRFYGAELILTPADQGMPGAVATARQMAERDSRYYLVKQFENPYNAESHEVSTAREIIQQMEGKLDVLVSGVGSGGTITGIARLLKEKIPNIKIAAVEPASSAVLSGKQAGPHKIQGIGAGFVPAVLNTNLIDRVVEIEDDTALAACRELARREAVLVGISSGAAIAAAIQLARELDKDQKVLAIAADGAEKYLSTELFD
jgi:cysteine synthase A